MDLALLLSAVLMGLAGSPHCAAMCGATCAALTGGARPAGRLWAFHLARLLSYAAAGAVAASSVGALAALGQAVGVLRPLWTLVHLLALGLGIWLLWQGRQPLWMERLGRSRAVPAAAAGGWQPVSGPGPGASAASRRPGRAAAALAGLVWVAWPCGLLQSALLVAGLANSAAGGAAVMGGFGASSALGLLLGPLLWAHLARGAQDALSVWAVRLAGLALVLASGWALSHGLWQRVAAWCGF